MSNRYGRNKKRAAREEIQRLGTDLQMTQNKLFHASSELRRRDSAAQDALDHMMKKQGLLKYAIEIISEEIGKAVGKQLAPHALKLFRSSLERDEGVVDFTLNANVSGGKSVEVLRGEINANYNMSLW